MTTVVILEFTSLLNSEGRPSGEGAFVWNRVLRSISELSGWKCTKWGPQSNDKHRIVALIGTQSIQMLIEILIDSSSLEIPVAPG